MTRQYDCECGRPRQSSNATSCDRCAYLDGGREKMGQVIAALRGTDGLSIREACDAVYGDASNTRRTAMYRTMQTLLERGRVRRYWREGDALEIARTDSGPAARFSRFAIGQWVYVLDGCTAKQWDRRAA